ncbi:RNA polymerase sigma factor [Streptomyces sp. NPDC021212]|uniref:RNA polymerase sigma factor n=1 Tax=Streptomyces sp. NPDC021212 TaxID=3365118 RepID=UPI00378DE4BE
MADRSPNGAGGRRGWRNKDQDRREAAYTAGVRPEEVLSPEIAKVWQEAVDSQSLVQVMLMRSVARPHAEDITQQTLLELWRYLTSEDPKPVGNVRAWMHRVSTNRLIDHIRGLQRRTEDLVENVDGAVRNRGMANGMTEATPESMRELHRKASEMAKALDGLVSPLEAETVVLHKAYLLTAKEVAEMLGTTEGAVRSATYTAVKKLRPQKRKVLFRFGRADSDKPPAPKKPRVPGSRMEVAPLEKLPGRPSESVTD